MGQAAPQILGCMKADIRIGISGWRYPPWRGTFYPKGLAQSWELQYASRALPAIEINSSFYALQTPARFEKWAADTPEDFRFTVKAPRFITHILRLQDPASAMANFVASGLFALGEKLGAVLWQFPPSMKFDPDQFEAFLKLLPHSAAEAAALAVRREPRMHDKELLSPPEGHAMRHAIEVRHDSFACPAFVALLRKYKAALVIADTGGRWPEFEDITADFVYLRLHGANQTYESGYSDEQLEHWAARIGCWSQGRQVNDAKLISDVAAPTRSARDVFCFFDNTMKVKAPENARRLLSLLGLERGLPKLQSVPEH